MTGYTDDPEQEIRGGTYNCPSSLIPKMPNDTRCTDGHIWIIAKNDETVSIWQCVLCGHTTLHTKEPEPIYVISRGIGCPECGAWDDAVNRSASRHENYMDCECLYCGATWAERIEDDEDLE